MNFDDADLERLLAQNARARRPERFEVAADQVEGSADPSLGARRGFFYQSEFEKLLEGDSVSTWLREAHISFEARATDARFPCFFAESALRQKRLCFAFADSIRSKDEVGKIARALASYLEEIRAMSAPDALMSSLIVYIRPYEEMSLHEYHAHAWDLMRDLNGLDAQPWPASIPKDPKDPFFSFSFAGQPIFVNVSTPKHVKRRSRNISSAMALVIQPSENFGMIPGRVRAEIRKRIDGFDDVAASPFLGSYGDPQSLEWRQYVLADDNTEIPATCPFHPKS